MIFWKPAEQFLRCFGSGLASLFFVLLFTTSSFAAINRPYLATADYIMLDIDTKVMYCEGQSEVVYGMLRFQANDIRIDVKFHILHAEGNVVIQSMRPMTMRESTEDSREAGIEYSVQTDYTDDEASEINRQIEENVSSERLGNVRTFEGDVLVFDLVNYAGVMMKTKETVERVYLKNDTLDEVSEMPHIGDGVFLYDEPELVANAWTAARIRVSPHGQYEGWRTNVWMKGNKIFPTPLPYFTNTARNVTPGNLRLKNINYSSNSDWRVGASYRYLEKQGKDGTVDLNYSGKGANRYSANLNQRFKLSNSMSGNFSLSNLLAGNNNYRMALSRVGSRGRFQSYSMNFAGFDSRNYSLNDNRHLFGVRVSSMINLNKYSSDSSIMDSLRMVFRLNGNTRYLGNARKYGYRLNSNIALSNLKNQDSDTNMFVGVSAFRSAIKISDTQSLNTSYNLGYGASSEGRNESVLGAMLGYNVNVGAGKMLNLSYRVNNNRMGGGATARQFVSMSYSYNKYRVMNIRLSSSYNVREDEMGTLSSRLDYTFNPRCSFWTDLVYDLKSNRFNMKIYSLRYDLLGNVINTRWNAESNDFVVDMASKF